MTKGEWKKLKPGDMVCFRTHDFDRSGEKPVLVPVTKFGKVTRFNSNYSQCEVYFKDSNVARWFGRLGIEVVDFGESVF